MAQAKVLVITGYGTNCERESAYAAKKAGADEVQICFFSDLIQEKINIQKFNFLIFPGGFLDGDDLGAAQAAAIRWKYSKTISGKSLKKELESFLKENKIILGICNGFQLLAKLGLLPALNNNYFERQVSLSYNDSAKFEDRWVYLKINPQSPCIFTKDLDFLYLPVRHGEGKVIPFNKEILTKIQKNNLIALQYMDPKTKSPTEKYPENPNGSPLGIAGLTDPSGRILGLMPHPEAYNHRTNHPAWTRNISSPLGTVIFEKGIEYLKSS
ncbi:phosphoribosylformylglycinamidine synthase [Desulfonauticus submarinus]|uniref:Phosphoribosylformylglycinamidine synthase n=1 Tax=Desulfonauticus submarinus TaxID=206665 RepID=A0A1H0ED03_9BACT|nr:phosphoribosylformylglycinamidine synthase subunit PurQ [Desulfonauticus submarinus]SDN80221.1 phosphoribosylformylglycinamidine synthase [Desulfonauticus submarinus]